MLISRDTISELLTIPPLENGDKLTLKEFERRYAAMPYVKKAELIEGIVYGEYIKLEPNRDSIICSSFFPGLWLDVTASFAGNLAKVLAVLQQGLASQEHQNFVNKLSNEKNR